MDNTAVPETRQSLGDVDTLEITGEGLTPREVAAVARNDVTVVVPPQTRERVTEARGRVRDIMESDESAYGLNTGFGDLADTAIPKDEAKQLQKNLVRSHAAGSGEIVDTETVRAMLLARLNTLVIGHSGVRECVVDHLVALLNEGVHPVVYSRGSLGASGDLAPLAHLSLVLIGEGEARIDGERLPGDDALARIGLEPLTLEPKEGLALINGTQLTTAIAALLVVDAERLVRAADISGSMATEVSMGTTTHCDQAIHELRPHDGQVVSARNLRRLTKDSTVVESHRDCDRVQDAYSIRCLPQVHGAVRDAVAHLREAVETELNSATDNPLVFAADEVDDRANGSERSAVLSGGNFHGEPLALRLDYLTSALCELAAISERRTDRLLNPKLQEGDMPSFLAPKPGTQSGLMIAQYTAASLLNEIRSLGRPSMDNTPVSGNQEDHVSMSAQSAYHARTALKNTQEIIAIELFCAVEAAEYLSDGLSLGVGTSAARELVRNDFPPLEGDRELQSVIDSVSGLLATGVLDEIVQAAMEEPLE